MIQFETFGVGCLKVSSEIDFVGSGGLSGTGTDFCDTIRLKMAEYSCFNLITTRQNSPVISSLTLSSIVRDGREAKNISALNSLVSKCPVGILTWMTVSSLKTFHCKTYVGIRMHQKLCSHQSAYLCF